MRYLLILTCQSYRLDSGNISGIGAKNSLISTLFTVQETLAK